MSTQEPRITHLSAFVGRPFNEQDRIHDLELSLNDEILARQRKNIEFMIRYYKNGGELPAQGKSIWVLDGKMIDHMPTRLAEGSVLWEEAVCLSFDFRSFSTY